jgi:hypothetical protein
MELLGYLQNSCICCKPAGIYMMLLWKIATSDMEIWSYAFIIGNDSELLEQFGLKNL